MITKFDQYNEGIKHLLVGPTIEEILKENPTSLLGSSLLDGDYELFQLALKHGADINYKDNWLLKHCSQTGKLEKVKILIKNGADVNKSESIIQTPLVLSSRNGHYEVVKFLLENGAGTDEWGRDLKQSLIWAESNIKNAEQDFNYTKIKEYEKIIELLKKYQWGEDKFKKGE